MLAWTEGGMMTRPASDSATTASGAAAPAAVYALGDTAGESARLERQADELRPEAVELLGRIGLRPGESAIDLGCGPVGVLDVLSSGVGPGGRVVGLDANPAHVEMARSFVRRRGLANVEVVQADARHTGLAADSFDVVHARTLLVTVPDPAEVLAEMVRLARPGGWVASQEPDVGYALCYPQLPAWDRLRSLFLAAFGRSGANPLLGRRIPELYRAAGLGEIEVIGHANTYPVGHSRRTILPDLVRSLWPTIIELGLADEGELAQLDLSLRQHLADPATLVVPHLLVLARGCKPAPVHSA
jgi:ubiquinone/menaquinone biosynthesis C-methylase UbiE